MAGGQRQAHNDLTEMRDQARKLDENQTKLTDQLDAWNARPERSLRADGPKQLTQLVAAEKQAPQAQIIDLFESNKP